MILLLIAIIPQIVSEDNSVTLSLIVIMLQIIYVKEFISLFCFPSILSIDSSKESHISAKLQLNVTLGEQ